MKPARESPPRKARVDLRRWWRAEPWLLSATMVWGALGSAQAQAQTAFKCTSGGTVYYADRPCAGDLPPKQIRAPEVALPSEEDDDNDHRGRQQQRLREEKIRKLQARQQVRQEQEEQREREALRFQQCEEMGRIRKAKQQQLPGMTAGEKNDYARFLENFNSRCKSAAP